MRHWEYRWLVHQLIRQVPRTPDPLAKIELLDLLTCMESDGRVKRRSYPYLSWARVSDINPGAAVVMLADLLSDPDPSVRRVARGAILSLGAAAPAAIPVLVRRAGSGDERDERRLARYLDLISRAYGSTFIDEDTPEIVSLRKAAAAEPRDAIPVHNPLSELRDPDAGKRIRAVWLLSVLAAGDPSMRRAVLDAWNDDDPDVRRAILIHAAASPVDEQLLNVLRGSLQGPERETALRVIGRLGRNGSVFADDLRRILEDAAEQPGRYPTDVVFHAARAWVAITGSTSLPISTLRSLLISRARPRDWYDQEPLAACLVSLGGKAPELLAEIEAALKSSPFFPVGSDRMYILLGGDHAHAARAMMTYIEEAGAAARTLPSPELAWLASNSAAVAMLVTEWFDDPDPVRRMHAAEILAYSGRPASSPNSANSRATRCRASPTPPSTPSSGSNGRSTIPKRPHASVRSAPLLPGGPTELQTCPRAESPCDACAPVRTMP